MIKITASTRKPIISSTTPTFGWNLSHDIDRAKKNRGMQIIRAAIKIAKKTTPLINPPTRGMYPNRVVIGEKNRQILATIRT